jgi:hypothetical protein
MVRISEREIKLFERPSYASVFWLPNLDSHGDASGSSTMSEMCSNSLIGSDSASSSVNSSPSIISSLSAITAS